MELKVTTRTILGKHTKGLRNKGFVPGEIYGRSFPNSHVSVPLKDFTKLYREAGEHTVFDLVNEDTKERFPVLISKVASDPLTRRFLTVDFRHIRMDEKIETKVPITFVGEAAAVKNGYVVVTIVNELHVKALPNAIPHSFTVDIAHLAEPGQSIHAHELTIPENVEVLIPKDTVLITVTEKAKEEVVAPPPAAEAAETTQASSETPAPETPTEK